MNSSTGVAGGNSNAMSSSSNDHSEESVSSSETENVIANTDSQNISSGLSKCDLNSSNAQTISSHSSNAADAKLDNVEESKSRSNEDRISITRTRSISGCLRSNSESFGNETIHGNADEYKLTSGSFNEE